METQTSTNVKDSSQPIGTTTDVNPTEGSTQQQVSQVPDFMTLYNIFYTTSRLNVTIHKGDKTSPALYYGQTKLIRTKPMFYIRDQTSDGNILSHAQIPWVTKTMYIGLGDGFDGESEKLTRDKILFRRSDYHFTLDDVTYDWIKDKKKHAATAYECVDDTGKVYATLLSGGAFNWSKGGELCLRNELKPDLINLLLASAMGIWTMEALNYQSLLKAYE